ncbi:unnamed protein product [Ambrosiozyma monospora]|uniref:Unnamed protein product n=1 Tax=Ambrosiozyma monospora TaxID=43982 RepID=A0ACB5TF34_AMBMO|nr:unnamed protein product [Ambrosiozyma monospora]
MHANKVPMDDCAASLKDSEGTATDEASPSPKRKVDWRFTMDYLFPPECLRIPNFLVFLCLVIAFFIDYTVFLTALFQYHQFVEHNTSIISSLKIFSMSVGVVLGATTFRYSYVVKVGTKILLITASVVALGTAIWITRVDFTKHNSFYKFEMISMAFNGFAVNYLFDVFLNSVMASTPMHLQGSVAGIYFTVGQVGIALGDAIFTSVVGELGVAETFAEKKAVHKNIVNGLYVGVAACAIAFIVSLFTVDTDSVKAKAEAVKMAESPASDNSHSTD